MKLFFSPLSPFARKVRIVAFEKTLAKELDLFKSERRNRPTEL